MVSFCNLSLSQSWGHLLCGGYQVLGLLAPNK